MEILRQVNGKDVKLISPDLYEECKECPTLTKTPNTAIEKGYTLESNNIIFCTGEETEGCKMEVQGDLIGGEKRYDAKLGKFVYGRNTILYGVIDCPALKKTRSPIF